MSKSKKRRYKLGDIKIPCVEQAFREFGRTKRSSARERVLSQIMVDIFQLRRSWFKTFQNLFPRFPWFAYSQAV